MSSATVTVHPRARGEQQRSTSPNTRGGGSSPRTRGTGAGAPGVGQVVRFIPAHAGNSRSSPAAGSARTVHPRARGEQPNGIVAAFVDNGSSPRTRGTARRVARGRRAGRFIPAHAGNRPRRGGCGRRGSVHPRARGEQPSWRSIALISTGSSPRTRGTVRHPAWPGARRRFIPAHAGNRATCTCSSAYPPVHPRARGEQLYHLTVTGNVTGSSPRTRGTDGHRGDLRLRNRFIPAHAGNSAARTCPTCAPAVHPRARGEQFSADGSKLSVSGSSPRTRGTVHHTAVPVFAERFIPAHAGNSQSPPDACGVSPVHPRARGEQREAATGWLRKRGSSPRTRGTESFHGQVQFRRRFIPAHAGNSG